MHSARRYAASLALVALVAVLGGCVDDDGTSSGLTAGQVPVAKTPPGAFGDAFPEMVLARCTEPLVAGAPDLRGLPRTLRAERGGQPITADDPLNFYVERIEQCGDRIVDMGGGTIATRAPTAT